MNYWGFRVDSNNRDFFFDEIRQGRLRQGWGYNNNQNLRLGDKVDISAKGNLSIYNKVKCGDYLIIPHLEGWDEMVIVQATQHFNSGYEFDISQLGDYGHIFPVKYIKKFSKYNFNVDGGIRETFKCRSRFWNIDKCENEIKKILDTDTKELVSSNTFEERFRNDVETVFDENTFAEKIYERLNKSTQASEWEFILCEGFKKILPDAYSIQTTSNITENKHGADIIIRIPGILDTSYVIAIQVKDYEDFVSDKVVDQICLSDEYFGKDEEEVLIDKYIIITKASKELNEKLKEKANKNNVKVLFDKEVKKLLTKMSKAFLSETIVE